jgi:hypothetical protein
VYPASLSFVLNASLPPGPQTFVLSNFTDSPVTWSAALDDADAAAPYFSFTPSGSTIAAGGTVTVSVTASVLSPNCVNPEAQLAISSTAPGAAPVVNLATTGWGYYLATVPGPIAFGSVSSPETLFIPYPGIKGNVQVGSTEGNTVYLESSNPSFVLNDTEPGFTINPSQYGWELTFNPSPSQLGPQSSTLTFFQPYDPSSDLCPPDTTTATGTSVAP